MDCVQLFDAPISFADAAEERRLNTLRQNWATELRMQPRAYVRGNWVECELQGDKKGNMVLRVGKKARFAGQIFRCEALPGRGRDLVQLRVQERWFLLQTGGEEDAQALLYVVESWAGKLFV